MVKGKLTDVPLFIYINTKCTNIKLLLKKFEGKTQTRIIIK